MSRSIYNFKFKESIGRVDLPGGNQKDMDLSIEKIKKYPADIIIYPGHYDESTIGFEKEKNIYLK